MSGTATDAAPTRPTRYTVRDWWREHRGQALFYVNVGAWRELGWWPIPGRIFQWNGRVPELWYYVKCRLWRRYNTVTATTLPPTWMDADARMLHINFAILESVIFREKIFEHNAADGDPADGESWAWALGEMLALWEWWAVARPAREAERERLLAEWDRLRTRDLRACDAAFPSLQFETIGEPKTLSGVEPNQEPQDTADAWAALSAADDVPDKEDDDMLGRLMHIRHYLWT